MTEDNPIRKAIEISTNLARAAWHSRLKKYFLYSFGIHIALLVLLSAGGIVDLAKGDTESGDNVVTENKPADSTEAPAPGAVRDETAPTGDKDDYYRRAGIDTTPPSPDDAPSPDTLLDDLLKSGGR